MWLDPLESRQLFAVTVSSPNLAGTVFVHGTSANDSIMVLPFSQTGFTFIGNGNVRNYNFSNLKNLRITLEGGNDALLVMGSHALPIDVDGGAGNDTIVGGSGNDTIHGGAGNDRINPGFGVNRIWGDAGYDTIDYSGQTSGVNVSLDDYANDGPVRNGHRRDNVHADIEAVLGTEYGDAFFGNNANNYFDGRGGNDLMRGGGGNDTILGGIGADTLFGDAGNDRLEAGNDRVADSIFWAIGDTYSADKFDKTYRKGIDW